MTARIFPVLWLFSFAAALMPLAVYEAQFFMAAFALIAASLSFAILKMPAPRNVTPITLGVLGPAFAFWALALLSVFLSEVPYVSYILFCFFSLMPLTICCALWAPDRDVFFKYTGFGLAVIFAGFSLWCLAQFFALPHMLEYGRVHWPFADPNALAGILLLGLFGALGLMFGGQNRVQSNGGLVLAIMLAGALFTTGSRGALVGLIAGLVVFAAFAWTQIRKHKKCSGILAAASAVLFVAMNYAAPEKAESAGHRIGATFSGETPIFWSRPDIWLSTWHMIRDHFWTGTGIGTFFLYYDQYRGLGDRNSAGRMAHSDPLQFWAEMGVFAPVVFYLVIGIAMVLTWRALRKLPKDDTRRMRILAPFCAIGGLVLHAHITFHFYVLPTLMLLGLLTVYWFVQVRGVLGDSFGGLKAWRLPNAEVLKVLIIAPLLLGSFFFLMLQGGVIYEKKAERYLYSNNFPAFVRAVNMADRISLHKNGDVKILAVNIPLGFLEAPGGNEKDAETNVAAAQKILDEAERLNPRSSAVPYYRARMVMAAHARHLHADGDPETLMQQALKLDPLYYPARVDLAKLYRARGDGEKAYTMIYEGLHWRRAATVPAEYYQWLAVIALEQGRRDVHEFALKMLGRIQRAQMGNLDKIK